MNNNGQCHDLQHHDVHIFWYLKLWIWMSMFCFYLGTSSCEDSTSPTHPLTLFHWKDGEGPNWPPFWLFLAFHYGWPLISPSENLFRWSWWQLTNFHHTKSSINLLHNVSSNVAWPPWLMMNWSYNILCTYLSCLYIYKYINLLLCENIIAFLDKLCELYEHGVWRIILFTLETLYLHPIFMNAPIFQFWKLENII